MNKSKFATLSRYLQEGLILHEKIQKAKALWLELEDEMKDLSDNVIIHINDNEDLGGDYFETPITVREDGRFVKTVAIVRDPEGLEYKQLHLIDLND
jgi:hypothetical protein